MLSDFNERKPVGARPTAGDNVAKKAKRANNVPHGQRSKRHPRRGEAPSTTAGETGERPFTCGHCQRHVPLLPSGGRHRNHCPYCLYSRHVDDLRAGDRANPCGGLMQPISAFQRPNGEHVIVHRCLRCGFERFNRIGADDDFDLVLALPVTPPRAALRDPQT